MVTRFSCFLNFWIITLKKSVSFLSLFLDFAKFHILPFWVRANNFKWGKRNKGRLFIDTFNLKVLIYSCINNFKNLRSEIGLAVIRLPPIAETFLICSPANHSKIPTDLKFEVICTLSFHSQYIECIFSINIFWDIVLHPSVLTGFKINRIAKFWLNCFS